MAGRGHSPHASPVAHFRIGSVDSFERQLEDAQLDLGLRPRDFVLVRHVAEGGEGGGGSGLLGGLGSIMMTVGLYMLVMRVMGGGGGSGSGGFGGLGGGGAGVSRPLASSMHLHLCTLWSPAHPLRVLDPPIPSALCPPAFTCALLLQSAINRAFGFGRAKPTVINKDAKVKVSRGTTSGDHGGRRWGAGAGCERAAAAA